MRLSNFLAFSPLLPLIAMLVACGGGGDETLDPGNNGNQNINSGSRALPGYSVHIEHTDSIVTVQIAPEADQAMPVSLAAWRGGDEYVDPAATTTYTAQADGSFSGSIPTGSGVVLWVRLIFADGSQMIAGRDAFTL